RRSRCRRGSVSCCWRRRGGWRRRSARCDDVALPASSRTTRAVTEVLVKGGVVFLYSRCSRGVTVGEVAVDHIEATLPLVQPQLEVGVASPRIVLRPPFDIEDAIRGTSRCGGVNAAW